MLAKYNIATLATGLNAVKFMQYDITPYSNGHECSGTDYYKKGGVNSWHDEVPFAKVAYWSGKIGTTYASDDIYDPTYTGELFIDSDDCIWNGDEDHAGCDYSPTYGKPGPISVALDDENTPDNYSVAYYVENYKNILIDMGAPIERARLLKKSEATSLINNNLLNYGGSDSFWLGEYPLKIVNMNEGYCEYRAEIENVALFSFSNYYLKVGVRPVIIVSKDNIK